ncbi:MAG: glutamate--tRNA ligase [Thermoleophilia bacterium]
MAQRNSNEKVRVRFAPSPTGHLHVGGARTALYNWLFARSLGGEFVLRIEDTDTVRSTEVAVQQILNGLAWLGLDWDEGPGVGGDSGPYHQMERSHIYQEAVQQLLVENKAFRCFCTPEELENAREQAKRAGKHYSYGGVCRELSGDEAENRQESGKESVIRLKTPDTGVTTVADMIRGDVAFENALLGDPILVRSNGVPTYNFAVAVDDTAMAITHVIRGDDHLPNTPRQLLVIEALGLEPPRYAHLPLILGDDRSPLSKRHGSVSIEEFAEKGYIREALVNYLALLGWSFDGETTLFTVAELVEKFSLERVGSTAAVFDNDKLLWMNGSHIRMLGEAELADRLKQFIAGSNLDGLPGRDGRPEIEMLVPMVQEKMKTLADFIDLAGFFFLPFEFEEQALAKLIKDDNAVAVLPPVRDVLAGIKDYDLETIERELRGKADELELKLGKFLQPIRIAVSGRTVTPGMFETLHALGREEAVSRIENAIRVIESAPGA